MWRIKSLIRVLFILATVTLAACATYSPQRIERDAGKWHPYTFHIDGYAYRIRVPPRGLIIKKPVTDLTLSSIDKYFIAATFGYDYGRGSYDDLAQLNLRVSVSRIMDGVGCNTKGPEYGDCIILSSLSLISANEQTYQYESLGRLRWFHQYGKQQVWDMYSIMLNQNYYLTVEAYYWDDLTKNTKMLADRRNLVEKIVRTVEKLN